MSQKALLTFVLGVQTIPQIYTEHLSLTNRPGYKSLCHNEQGTIPQFSLPCLYPRVHLLKRNYLDFDAQGVSEQTLRKHLQV